MKIEFLDKIPDNYPGNPVLISGDISCQFEGRQFLSIVTSDENVMVFEIRFEYHCSPFRQAELVNDLLVVGFEKHFYLFDIRKKSAVSILELSGYFGHFYLDNNLVYVADCDGLYCLTLEGDLIWKNNNLGIDGVIVNSFNNSEIHGSGEWDPPGGWKDFVLDRATGKIM